MSWTALAVSFPILLRPQLKNNLLIYLVTPFSRVLLEKLTGSQPVKKFPAFYRTPRLITVLTSARHLSLFWATWIQSMSSHPTSWRSYCPPIYAWVSQVVSYTQVSPPKPWIHLSSPPYVLHALPISFLLKENIKMYSGRPVLRYSFIQLGFTLSQARKALRESRGIALLYFRPLHEKGWGVTVTPRQHLTPGKDPVPIVQEAGWASGPVWTGAGNLVLPGFDPRTVQPVGSRYTDYATRPF